MMHLPRRCAPLLALGLIVSMSAAAEPKLLGSTPNDGATLSSPPTEIVLTFAGPVALTGVTVESDGAAHAITSLPDERAAHLVIKAPKLKPGKYRVQWNALSDSTHVTSGVFGFEIK